MKYADEDEATLLPVPQGSQYLQETKKKEEPTVCTR